MENNSDHEQEVSASFDPGFSAALAGSFKMDYFNENTNSAGLPNNRNSANAERSESFTTPTNKSNDKDKRQSVAKEPTSKLEEILEGKGVFVMNTSDNPTPAVSIDVNEENEEDSSPELKTRARNERVIFSPSSAQVNNNMKNPSRIKDMKSQSILETRSRSDFEPPSRTFTESFSDRNLMGSMISPKNSIANKSVNLNSESISFVDKSQWTEDLTCYVCSRAFSKMDRIFTHHCRVCGRSVCGDCSSKKINNDRACDVCYYKLSNKEQEDSRQEMLLNKINKIEAYKQQIIAAEQKLAEMSKMKKDMERKMLEEMEQKAAGLQVLQDEKTKRQEALDRKKTENQSLKESVEVNRAFLREKEEETQEIREVLNTIKLELAEKKGNFNSKQEEVDRLSYQRNHYSQSVCSYGEAQNGGSFYSRDPYYVGSCHPSLPGGPNEDNSSSDNKKSNASRRY